MSIKPSGFSQFESDRTRELCNVLYVIVRAVVTRGSDVIVEPNEVENGSVVIEIIVWHGDLGAVIGREGKVAEAIRQYVTAFEFNRGGSYSLDFKSRVPRFGAVIKLPFGG